MSAKAAALKHSANPRRRKVAHIEEHEGGHERWLVTYADMLTLLLVLFIVLFSISVVNTSKFIALRTSLSSAFGQGQHSLLDGGTGITDTAVEGQGQDFILAGIPEQARSQKDNTAAEKAIAQKAQDEAQDFKRIREAIEKSLAQQGMSGAVQFAVDRRGLVITVLTNALVFPGNSATLLPEGDRLLGAIVPPLTKVTNNVEVDGHTNQQNVSTEPYPSGWELSTARASSVVRYLAANGIKQSRLSAVGFSDQRPLVAPSNPQSVTRNRRVDIVVLSALTAVGASAATSAATTPTGQ